MSELQIGLLVTAYGVYFAGMSSSSPAVLSVLQTSLAEGYSVGLTKSAGVNGAMGRMLQFFFKGKG